MVAVMLAVDFHQPRRARLAVDRPRHADGLMRRPKRRVATDLAGDHVTGSADRGDIVALGWFAQPPI
jgi:hypothetical protein